MSQISRQEVIHLAKLANIDLSDEQIEGFTKSLSDVLELVNHLAKLDTAGIPPTAQVTQMTNVLRDDMVTPGLSQDEVLKNAPAAYQGFIKVKSVF